MRSTDTTVAGCYRVEQTISSPLGSFRSSFFDLLLPSRWLLTLTKLMLVTALQRKYQVWKNGIYWGTCSGVEAPVEINDVRVLLLTRCLKGKEVASVFLRSSVLSKVRQAKNELLPQAIASECFLQSVVATQHPIPESSDASAIPVADIAQTIAQREACAVAKDSKPEDVGSLLHFEPYAHLPQEVLVKVLDQSEPHQSDRISNSFIQRLSACPLDTQSKLLAALCISCKRVSPSSDLVTALKVWKRKTKGSYKGLRTTLDHFSIFAGRSPPVSPCNSQSRMSTDVTSWIYGNEARHACASFYIIMKVVCFG